jgi:molybdopterin-guanine dinucleotide biosynthesis protein A
MTDPAHPDAARIAVAGISLGILAGGRASRLGGMDKAWMRRGGVPQVLRIAHRFDGVVGAVLVSANADLPRYAQSGLRAIPDRYEGIGPLGGLEALAQACSTPWLLTLPVDILEAGDGLVDALAAAGGQGACVEDDAGLQPLAALWNAAMLREGASGAIAVGEYSVQVLQRRLGMRAIRMAGRRLGNLNTLQDLQAAGVETQ